MAEEYSFFNSVSGDREYTAEQFTTYFKQFLTSGLYHKNNVPSLKVTIASGLQTNLEAGSAYLEGYMYKNTDNLLLTHAAADATNPRIDRVVIRLDRTVGSRFVKAFVKAGTPASSPLPPALTRNNDIYEISLSQVRVNAGATTIASVKDERLDVAVAGLVSSLITVPTDEFEAEWRAWFDTIKTQNPAYGGMTIYIQTTEPSNPKDKDIWIDTSG